MDADVLVLLDLDGTLLQAGDRRHAEAFVTALREVYGVPATLQGVAVAGMLDRQIAHRALAAHGLDDAAVRARIDEFTTAVGRHFATMLGERSLAHLVLPGVVDTLALLSARGATLTALTGNARGVAEGRLRAAGLDGQVPDGAYGCEADERHELVALARARAEARTGWRFPPERTVIVGDTPRDVDAARGAGCRVVAVATGNYDVNALAACGPDAVLADMADPEHAAATILGVCD